LNILIKKKIKIIENKFGSSEFLTIFVPYQLKHTKMKPSNPNITISELGQENTFVSGNKNWRIDWADYKGKRFEVGVTVKWRDPDAKRGEQKVYVGKIEWLIIIDGGEVQMATDMPLGRLDVDQVVFVKKAIKVK